MEPPVDSSQLASMLQQEVDLHNTTRFLLMQAEATVLAWQQAYNTVYVDLLGAHFELGAAKARVQELVSQNQRLSLSLNHLVTIAVYLYSS
jgi:hypothetical protein